MNTFTAQDLLNAVEKKELETIHDHIHAVSCRLWEHFNSKKPGATKQRTLKNITEEAAQRHHQELMGQVKILLTTPGVNVVVGEYLQLHGQNGDFAKLVIALLSSDNKGSFYHHNSIVETWLPLATNHTKLQIMTMHAEVLKALEQPEL